MLRSEESHQLDPDPYLRLMHEWAWAHYDRSVCAHMRGDDVLSLASAQPLVRLLAAVEKEAPARGLAPTLDINRKPQLFLPFLSNVGALAADEERRVKAGKVERVLDVGVDRFPDQAKRIASLIRDLEEARATQWGQPGGVSLGNAAVVKALIQEGDAAVEPLLQCLASDDRLTRSVSFHRDFFTNRNLLRVDDTAFSALCEILKTRTFGPHTEHPYYSVTDADRRADVAREIREYWNKIRQLPEAERWYATLADDQATPQQWLEVAQKIVKPQPRQAGAAYPPPIVTLLAPPRAFAGAELRNKRNPSVAELLSKRAGQISVLDRNSSAGVHTLRDACEITLGLAKWDSAEPDLRKRIEQCREMFADKSWGPYAKQLGPWLSRMCAAGIAAGDPQAAEQYAAWLTMLSPDQIEPFDVAAVFHTLTCFPDDPRLKEAAELTFLPTSSPWRPRRASGDARQFTSLLNSPLVGVPAFRELLLREMKNGDPAAILQVDAKAGSYSIRFGGSQFSQTSRNAADPDWPAAAAQVNLRVCDLYAWQLTRLEGSPRFEPYWPTQRRDAAIGQFAEFLQQWGNCFRGFPNLRIDASRLDYVARFHISNLVRPATADDVKNGRAIFTLAGAAEVKTIPLPQFPQMARWKTLEQFPLQSSGEQASQKSYDRGGYLWQAEEVLENGKWQRYYGFVGNHIIAKVPAEEIELLEKFGEERTLRW